MAFPSKPKDTLPLWLLCANFLLGHSAVGKEFSASQLKLFCCHKKLQPTISDKEVNQDRTLQPQHIFPLISFQNISFQLPSFCGATNSS